MPSVASRLIEKLVWLLLRPPSTPEAGELAVRKAALRPAAFGPPKRIRSDVAIKSGFSHGWPVYSVEAATGRIQRSVVYIHGGAFYGEITPFHWRLIARIAAETGSRVLVPIYPLVPQGTARDVVETVSAIVTDELDASGDAVSLCGDSAGGTIALAAALRLRDAGIQLRRTVLIHPAVDLTVENPDIVAVEHFDPLLRTAALRPIFEMWRGELDLADPLVSPLRGEMAGLGPLTVFSGTHDITNPDTRLLVTKARAARVDVDYHEGTGLIHASPALPTREGRGARELIVEALR